ncbi:uncharacterized protein Eint_060610 [Encephalitozoon intestinalis ATCC 50506]|uniref:Uncharacterized protein n=1 Tax=Encephalitozoon intestinalis (strain ATCC 50506) TaxID=876142 RepID=E0S7J0_ENCIT|nr:uncharacterized protein Eint_060610 [Encephalitozoon intestinalis ATCC 50506]ADM11669.1 hypothetical protein Eint_060610 [Encephalitozoon intestinalis ATCC 50506]UTX45406.1 hypothetical protein GPK93_06g09580 [Encephalitozoon intestinalis]
MDIYQVMVGLEKCPENYVEEYGRQLELFSSLVRLPKQPGKTIRQTLSFLLAFPTIDKRLSETLVSSVETIKCHKIKRTVVESLFRLRRRGLVSGEQLLKNLMEHHPDPKSVLKRIRSLVSEEEVPCILEYYKKGTDKQRSFCYYLVVYLFRKGCGVLEKEVCEGLFADGKVGKICRMYFLDQIDFEEEGKKAMELLSAEASRFGKMLFANLQENMMEREEKIMKMKIYVLFRSRYGLKASVARVAMGMLNPEKSDIKDLMEIIVEEVTVQDVLRVIDVVGNSLCSEFKDDDFVVYGLNMLREIYCKFDPEAARLRDEGGGKEDSETQSLSISEDGERNEKKEDGVVDRMKERISKYIECFKGSKSKSISYGYMSVVNVMRHRKYCGRNLEFIRRKASKEERVESMKGGRDKKEKYCGGKHSKGRRISRRKKSSK